MVVQRLVERRALGYFQDNALTARILIIVPRPIPGHLLSRSVERKVRSSVRWSRGLNGLHDVQCSMSQTGTVGLRVRNVVGDITLRHCPVRLQKQTGGA